MYILRHTLFQGIFLTQGSNLDLLHCRWILEHLSYQGSLTECNHILLLKYISKASKLLIELSKDPSFMNEIRQNSVMTIHLPPSKVG